MKFLNLFRKKQPTPVETNSGSIQIKGTEKILFEKALKLYVFVHHKPHSTISSALADQLKFTGNAVYSLVLNWVKDGKPSLEYMDFLNGKLHELRMLDITLLTELEILPDEVDEIELNSPAKFSFTDEEEHQTLRISYTVENAVCEFEIIRF